MDQVGSVNLPALCGVVWGCSRYERTRRCAVGGSTKEIKVGKEEQQEMKVETG